MNRRHYARHRRVSHAAQAVRLGHPALCCCARCCLPGAGELLRGVAYLGAALAFGLVGLFVTAAWSAGRGWP